MKFTENEITAEIVKKLRTDLGVNQSQFWSRVGVQQAVSSGYESGKKRIPRSVRILIVANYVSGVKISTASHDDVHELAKLGAIQSNIKEARSTASEIVSSIDNASAQLASAKQALSNI